MQLLLDSENETARVAASLAKLLGAGDLIGLEGDLGAGKTSFARAAIYGLGVDPNEAITSPTFALIHHYEGRLPIVHADFYRLMSESELEELGVEEMLCGGYVMFVEWGRKFADFALRVTLWAELSSVSEQARGLRLRATGPRGEAILAGLRQLLMLEEA
jgi:tRNA threonylcarbamoyladenosine biosynthesis protein TsaE